MLYVKPHGYYYVEGIGCINYGDIQHGLISCYNGCPFFTQCDSNERSYCKEYPDTIFLKLIVKSGHVINVPYKYYNEFAKHCKYLGMPLYDTKVGQKLTAEP